VFADDLGFETEPVPFRRLGLKAEIEDEGSLTAHPQITNKAMIARSRAKCMPSVRIIRCNAHVQTSG
jgi:hypothetical protein